MTEDNVENLVNSTFTQAYNEGKFRYFIRVLLQNNRNDYEELEERASTGKFIPESFKGKIHSYKRLGKFIDPDGEQIDILAVKVLNRQTLENARTLQRNFIARYLNGSRGGVMKEAALVAFHSDDCEDWRFSLVRMDYAQNEEGKIEKQLTPARRFSFLVGLDEKTHTARSQWLPLLGSDNKITLSNLGEAFNIEVVTNEFFKEYRTLYIKLKKIIEKYLENNPKTKAEFETKTIKPDDFAKRLLGQIVFLYFLQKKGWLGVTKNQEWGTGPKDFLKNLLDKKIIEYDNFFNDVLEPLFYKALAVERKDNYYPVLKCNIPFLNGGLFEPIGNYDWNNIDILLDNSIFEEILRVFDLYNFTVREDEPLDKEVAIDPEMLGKVFENLIPENERKGAGAYYTPREVVHYMSQESLINYLDAKLNVKNSPPDTYSPIISRQDLIELIHYGDIAQEHDAIANIKHQKNEEYKGHYQYRLPKSIHNYAKEIDDALAHVKICDPAIGSGAFPVGVMNEIVRIRGVLNACLGKEGRTPYEFKHQAIRESIYGVDMEPSAVDIAKLRLWLSLIVDEDNFSNIKPLPNLDYKICTGDSLLGIGSKDDLIHSEQLDKLEQLKTKYFSTTDTHQKSEINHSIKAIIEDLTSTHTRAEGLQKNSRFDYRVFFSEVFRENNGFDIIIANPPYISAMKFKEEYGDKIRDQQRRLFHTASGAYDLYILFFELGARIMKNNGVLCYITPNKYLSVKYASKLREYILENLDFMTVIDATLVNVFENVSVHPVITILSKSKYSHISNVTSLLPNNIDSFIKKEFKESHIPSKSLDMLPEKVWGFLLSNQIKILSKIIKDTSPLSFFAKINAATTAGEAEEYGNELQNHKDTFKVINTGTIQRFNTTWGHRSLRHAGTRYLTPYISESVISSKRRSLYESPKILFAKMAKYSRAFYDSKGDFAALNVNCIHSPAKNVPLDYLVGYANSDLFMFFYNQFFASQKMGNGYPFTSPQLRIIPMKEPNEKTIENVVSLVRQITNAADDEDVEKYEQLMKKLNTIFYELHSLNSEEISIIESTIQ